MTKLKWSLVVAWVAVKERTIFIIFTFLCCFFQGDFFCVMCFTVFAINFCKRQCFWKYNIKRYLALQDLKLYNSSKTQWKETQLSQENTHTSIFWTGVATYPQHFSFFALNCLLLTEVIGSFLFFETFVITFTSIICWKRAFKSWFSLAISLNYFCTTIFI